MPCMDSDPAAQCAAVLVSGPKNHIVHQLLRSLQMRTGTDEVLTCGGLLAKGFLKRVSVQSAIRGPLKGSEIYTSCMRSTRSFREHLYPFSPPLCCRHPRRSEAWVSKTASRKSWRVSWKLLKGRCFFLAFLGLGVWSRVRV